METLDFRRHRRLRRTAGLRSLVRETEVTPGHLVYPIFVEAGLSGRQPIEAMPGQDRLGLDAVEEEARGIARQGIGGVLLFGLPASKDEEGSTSWAADGVVQEAIRRIKRAAPDLVTIGDVCLCEYTSHGHCGVLRPDGSVDNDSSLPLLARMATSLADAGCDVIAPSDMMDGRVAAIRASLDASGYQDTPILSYAAKFASAFYGPFREAAGSTPAFGDRRGYQADPANGRIALDEVHTDIAEGADMVMVKPALPYLDILRSVRDQVDVPVAAYNVSGEYSMLMAAAERGWIDRDRAIDETLTSIRRAGADIVITYHARQWCEARGYGR
jgi:porphobilinogen synthase